MYEKMKITGREVRAIGWMMIKQTPSRNSPGDVSTVEPCVTIAIAHLMMNFDRRYALGPMHSKTLSQTALYSRRVLE